uniref:PHD finger protein 11 n=1 Tax=Crocodylus porosus TaxID=8502 RepID=A0A7M4FRY9_CROPO
QMKLATSSPPSLTGFRFLRCHRALLTQDTNCLKRIVWDTCCSASHLFPEKNLAVHQDCLLYSSGFVESEEYSPHNLDIRFDVASVLSEIKRGKRLMCNFCRKKGATVGCEERACRRSYHYFCARCDDAADYCTIWWLTPSPAKTVSSVFHLHNANAKKELNFYMGGQRLKHDPCPTCLGVSLDRTLTFWEYLKKTCKQAGLLDDIFEAMLDTLHLAQEKLMDDNTSETDFLLTTGTEEKIQELLETRKRLDTRIELLQELKEEVVLPVQENRASASSSVSE